VDTGEVKLIIESLLFAFDEPLRVERVQRIMEGVPRSEIQKALNGLIDEYNTMDRSFSLIEVAGGYQFRTRAAYADWIKKLRKTRQPRLAQASVETLAIVAYRQPIVRAEIEQIRGVDSGGVLRGLFKKGLIRIIGKKDVPGRPILYGTSRRFLEFFGLKDLSNLPTLKELEEISEEEEP
jgi:segregation and condensation protein B